MVSRPASLRSRRGWRRYPVLLGGVAAVLLAGACVDRNPAREKLQAWLVALNAADPGQIRRVNEGATPGAALLTSRTLSLADSTGGLALA